MKTEDLIAQLAAEPRLTTPPGAVGQGALRGIALGLVVTATLFLVFWGIRPAVLEHLSIPVTAAKTLLALALALLALPLALRSARPGAGGGPLALAIWAVPAAAAALFVWAFATTGAGARLAGVLGHSIHVCLPSITVLSVPILSGLLLALRRGAPVRPALSGALAGLVAGGLATTVYSLFCTEDSPLFYAVWYSSGILIATGIGALAGKRWLRW